MCDIQIPAYRRITVHSVFRYRYFGIGISVSVKCRYLVSCGPLWRAVRPYEGVFVCRVEAFLQRDDKYQNIVLRCIFGMIIYLIQVLGIMPTPNPFLAGLGVHADTDTTVLRFLRYGMIPVRIYHKSFSTVSAPGTYYDNNKVLPLSYCLLYTSPSPRDRQKSRMPSSA